MVKCGLTTSTGLVVSLQIVILWSQRRSTTTTIEQLSAFNSHTARQPQQLETMKNAGHLRDATAPQDSAVVDDVTDNRADKADNFNRTENKGTKQTWPNQVHFYRSIISSS